MNEGHTPFIEAVVTDIISDVKSYRGNFFVHARYQTSDSFVGWTTLMFQTLKAANCCNRGYQFLI